MADVWIAGAGVFEPNVSSFFHDKEEESYKAFRINAEHPIKLTRIAMRSCLEANKAGVVLIVASGAGVNGFYGAPLYCATKHAVVGFTKSMARELASRNITVNAVAPGFIDTEMVARLPETVRSEYLGLIPAGRLGTADEVADTVGFLVRAEAGYITGQVIGVNGGLYM